MRHLIVCPEYPPARIPPGGIGTYVVHIARLLAEAGETVHVLATRWEGAPKAIEESCDGRLIIHRVPLDEPLAGQARRNSRARTELEALEYPAQRFAWQAGFYVEELVRDQEIDLIEVQDYAAPLYFFLLRRALGQGPRHQPPCVIHLHSPTEFIFRYNEWEYWRPDYHPVKRLEDYSIPAADAYLCPSRYLARQAVERYRVPADLVSVIPYPAGDTPLLERSERVWAEGSICYIGRLEPRKGVIEWVDAAVSVADDYPHARFEFFGEDLPYTAACTVREHLQTRIPARMQQRFLFHGSRPRKQLLKHLRAACAVAIPSRWENFPNTCIEAMCTGTPVLVSPEGGMAEMVEDGRSGWVAPSASPAGLAEALRCLLSVAPAERAAMGRAAAERIRALCDNAEITARHLEVRARIAKRGAERSLRVPRALPWPGSVPSDVPVQSRPHAGSDSIATVIACQRAVPLLEACLDSLQVQRRPPETVVVVAASGTDATSAEAAGAAQKRGWRVVRANLPSRAEAWNVGTRAALEYTVRPAALLFLDENLRLDPGFVDTMAGILRSCPEVGFASTWTRVRGRAERVHAPPCPAFPYQLIGDDTGRALLVRVEALEEAGLFSLEMADGYERWDLANVLLARGWVGITVPALLTDQNDAGTGGKRLDEHPMHARLRRAMLQRVPEVARHHAEELVLLLEAQRLRSRNGLALPMEAGQVMTPRNFLRLPFSDQLALGRKAATHPGRVVRWLAWHARRAAGRVLRTLKV